MAIEIPSGLSTHKRGSHAIRSEIRDNYLSSIFDKLRKAGADVGRVSSRLNCSNTEEAIPVWAGTYEDDNIEEDQGFKANDIRFGRSNRSKVYEETITDFDWKIHERDWTQGFTEKEKDEYGPAQALGPRSGCMYQLYIAIRVNDGPHYRHVGTITVGFRKKPNRQKVNTILKKWADEDNAKKEKFGYVKYLKDTFNLGGPVF